MVLVMSVAEGGVAHRHQFREEENEDGHKNNALYPGVFGDDAPEAGILESLIGRREELDKVSTAQRKNMTSRARRVKCQTTQSPRAAWQAMLTTTGELAECCTHMYKSSSYDDTRSKIFCNEKYPFRYGDTLIVPREYREDGTYKLQSASSPSTSHGGR